MQERLTPKDSGPHKRYTMLKPSIIWGTVALVAVFLILVLVWALTPPVR